ncbi:hypothetical protein [Tardiphaga robiniae]|uniref:Secreted protein n=1 Tax=Tardiphaga robiniae TaxID=943830 RepID=A0A109ZY49_9BRAD|nr:hypothetical protein [Tardiphaga robiniae]AMH39420.1 hypothetical protein PROKKA_00607 [Tardiphaga robiniae]KZD25416.1 hypothetical protein A4A58_03000 [Tardiphaga robiniae]
MRNLIVAAGTAILFICTAFAANAEPRDSVERGDRMDRDALRDDIRVDRLKIPQHPIVVEEPQQPVYNTKSKQKSKRSTDNSR